MRCEGLPRRANPAPEWAGRRQARACPAPEAGRIALLQTLAAIACALLLTVLPSTGRAAMYKWVDEQGVTHYSDKMPPEAVNRGSVTLDTQGRALKKIEPAPTSDQLRARQMDADRKEAAAREQELTARRDRALQQSYTTEAEIELARTRVLTTIDSQLQAAQGFARQLAARRQELVAKRTAAGAKGLPVAEERELESIDAELAKQAVLIDLKRREREQANARYDADKARWRELRAIAEANADAAAGVGTRTVRDDSVPAKDAPKR